MEGATAIVAMDEVASAMRGCVASLISRKKAPAFDGQGPFEPVPEPKASTLIRCSKIFVPLMGQNTPKC